MLAPLAASIEEWAAARGLAPEAALAALADADAQADFAPVMARHLDTPQKKQAILDWSAESSEHHAERQQAELDGINGIVTRFQPTLPTDGSRAQAELGGLIKGAVDDGRDPALVYAAKRISEVPLTHDHRQRKAADDFVQEVLDDALRQSPPPDPLAAKSVKELDGDLRTMFPEGDDGATVSGVRFQPEVSTAEIAAMQADLDRLDAKREKPGPSSENDPRFLVRTKAGRPV